MRVTPVLPAQEVHHALEGAGCRGGHPGPGRVPQGAGGPGGRGSGQRFAEFGEDLGAKFRRWRGGRGCREPFGRLQSQACQLLPRRPGTGVRSCALQLFPESDQLREPGRADLGILVAAFPGRGPSLVGKLLE